MSESRNNKKIIAAFVVILAVVIIAVGVSMFTDKKDSDTKTPTTSETDNTVNTSQYKDGAYSAEGSYLTPGGTETVTIGITLEDGAVTDTTFASEPQNKKTVEYQGKFKENYMALVVGKAIDEITLSHVSGSSLTSKGFHDALDKIKNQAKN